MGRLGGRVVMAVLGGAAGATFAQTFDVSIHGPNGAEISRFVATADDQHINDMKIGSDGNLWICRSDNSHSNGVPNPNDMVAVFDLNGNELRTLQGGGMRNPTAVNWDSAGNIYVAGEENNFTVNMYKYDSAGNFITKFRTSGWNLIDVYNDIVVTANDRIFVSAWWGTGSADQMTEFNAAGQTINTFSPTGPTYFHRPMTFGPGGTIFVYTPRNGSGDDLVREFALDGTQLSTFNIEAAVPGSFFIGLEPRGGNLFCFDRNSVKGWEFTTGGIPVQSTPIQGLTDWVSDFTFAPNGDFIFANQTKVCTGSETLKAKCKNGGNLKAVIKKGVAQTHYTVCVDEGAQCKEITLNKKGKGKANFTGLASGRHLVETSPCFLSKDVECP